MDCIGSSSGFGPGPCGCGCIVDGIGCDANDGSAARFRAATKLQKYGKQARRSIMSLRRAGRTCRLDRSHMDDALPHCKIKLAEKPGRVARDLADRLPFPLFFKDFPGLAWFLYGPALYLPHWGAKYRSST